MHDPGTESQTDPRYLQDIELNAIRYAAGFVIRKIMNSKKHKKMEGYDEFVYCLKRMVTDYSDVSADCDGNVDSLVEYTKTWLSKTDRGGLSHVSDETFWLFCEIEIVVYEKLKNCYAGHQQPVTTITALAIQDEDVGQTLASSTGISDKVANQLLACIIEEWIVLRGHSLRKTFVERHKKLVKSKALGEKKSAQRTT